MLTGADYNARLQRAQLAVADTELAALLISPGPDLRYLIGYDAPLLDRLTCLIVPASGQPLIVVPELEATAALASLLTAAHVEVLTWRESENPYALVASRLPRFGMVAVGDHMWAEHVFFLHSEMPQLGQRSAGAILKALRVCKDESEIAALKVAAAAIDSVHARMPEWLRPGRTEADVGIDIRGAMLKAGHVSADLVIVASGPNSSSPHHLLSSRALEHGDVVVVDIGGVMPSGYWSDCTRTYIVGEPSSKFLNLYSVLQTAQESACQIAKIGAPLQIVDTTARDIITEAGYGACFNHRTGHGIGLDAHEEPFVSPSSSGLLANGMVFSVEPGIYLPGYGGARIEDIVACTNDGPQPLNMRPHDLFVIDV